MDQLHQPEPISATNEHLRIRRITEIATNLGFVGRVEYLHVYSRTGGAQYCVGPSADDDIMVVYAEAFERDANPDDFNLEALIAHECGHQRLLRQPNLRIVLAKFPGGKLEEVLASLVASILLGETEAAKTLVWKATAELSGMGVKSASTVRFIERLRRILRDLL
jgi:hypothetical protein